MQRLIVIALLLPVLCEAHGPAGSWPNDKSRRIEFPDLPDRLTLVVDLHTHSVFSDGHVWPRTRTEEALMDGLDGLAITEHLEWQPHRGDIPNPDFNRAYEIASTAAAGTPLMVISGAEITRRGGDGHVNAVFLDDVNPLLPVSDEARTIEDAELFWDAVAAWPAQNALDEALRQGAFTFWNHPAWSGLPEAMPALSEHIERNIAAGKIHGVEVVNGHWYSEPTFALALERDLALIGTSDVHELIDWDYRPYDGGHRPVTLVFAEERTPESLRKALFEKRTAVYYEDLLLAREREMQALLAEVLTVESAAYEDGDNLIELRFRNHSDLKLILENQADFTFLTAHDLIEIGAHGSYDLTVTAPTRPARIELAFRVLNALTAPKTPARIRFVLDVEPPSPK